MAAHRSRTVPRCYLTIKSNNMKQSDNDLLHFGNMLSEVCAQTKTTVREICQEVGISSTTFENV